MPFKLALKEFLLQVNGWFCLWLKKGNWNLIVYSMLILWFIAEYRFLRLAQSCFVSLKCNILHFSM